MKVESLFGGDSKKPAHSYEALNVSNVPEIPAEIILPSGEKSDILREQGSKSNDGNAAIKDLINIGLKPDKKTIETIKLFRKYRIAVTTENIGYIRNITEALPELTLKEAVYLLSKGIMLTENDKGIAVLLRGNFDSNTLLGELENIINAAEDVRILEDIYRTLLGLPDDTPETTGDTETAGFLKSLARSQQSADLKHILADIINGYALDPETDSTRSAVLKMHAALSLLQFARAVREVLRKADGPGIPEAAENLDNMAKNLSLLNELQNQYIYLQFPVKFHNHRTTGKLFILKKNRNKPINPDDTAFLLSLTTEHLGQVDTFIKINKKQVGISMSVMNDKIADFVRKSGELVKEILSEAGYNLASFDVRLLKLKVNLLNVEDFADFEYFGNKTSIDLKV